KNDQLAREGKPPLPEAAANAIRQPIIDAANKEGNAYYSTANLWDDGILDPATTRDTLGLAIAVALNSPLDERNQGHGVFRM
ncbi:MAG: methylcrotonoyl-CoA carboxylase, partial [Deltaproteobacteria bacterium]|nr:methylcrotonoyl-CoA carboxylase [Deltaproteobacteria bacterium]MBW2535494.1 methylcrotonoyl-CoA carboxylase [Deltaproteobacteria bacterium]